MFVTFLVQSSHIRSSSIQEVKVSKMIEVGKLTPGPVNTQIDRLFANIHISY